jgi:hypothetical protein
MPSVTQVERTKHRPLNNYPVFLADHHTECDAYYEIATVIDWPMLTWFAPEDVTEPGQRRTSRRNEDHEYILRLLFPSIHATNCLCPTNRGVNLQANEQREGMLATVEARRSISRNHNGVLCSM